MLLHSYLQLASGTYSRVKRIKPTCDQVRTAAATLLSEIWYPHLHAQVVPKRHTYILDIELKLFFCYVSVTISACLNHGCALKHALETSF
jgi:hypothetical protein